MDTILAGAASLAAHTKIVGLEVQRNLRRQRPRGYIVRSAEGREEVVQRVLVRDVDRGQVEVHLVVFLMEDVVLAKRCVEKVARRDARRVMVVILLVWRGNLHEVRLVPSVVARGEAGVRSSRYPVTDNASLELFVGSEAAEVDSRLAIRQGDSTARTICAGGVVAGHGARNEPLS